MNDVFKLCVWYEIKNVHILEMCSKGNKTTEWMPYGLTSS